MKKLINNPEDVVKEELKGIELHILTWLKSIMILTLSFVRCAGSRQSRAGLRWGSGHEPMHGGFVGKAC